MKRYGFALFMLICFSSFPEWKAHAQAITSDPGYIVERWSVEDGLPVNSVVDIIQAHDGYLWFTTFDGLVRFDGVKFKVYRTEQYPEMITNRLAYLWETPDSTIWIITDRENLIRFKNGIFDEVGPEEGLGSNFATSFFESVDGSLWIGTHNGVSVYKNGVLSPFKPEIITGRLYLLEVEGDRSIWYTDKSKAGLYRYSNGKIDTLVDNIGQRENGTIASDREGRKWFLEGGKIYSYHNNVLREQLILPERIKAIYNMGFDHQQNLWIYTKENGAFILNTKENTVRALAGSENHRVEIRVNSFVTEEVGDFWFVSSGGVWLNEKQIMSLKGRINAKFLDREGNMWIGTSTQGLIRIKKNLFNVISEPEGLPNKNVHTVMEDNSGAVWVGMYGKGAAKIVDNRVVLRARLTSLQNGGSILSIYQAKNGTIYTSANGESMLELAPMDSIIQDSEYNKRDNVPISISAFYEDEHEIMWAGGENGLFRLEDDVWKKSELPNDNGDVYVKNFVPGPDSSLWMATNGSGIMSYKDSSYTIYNKEVGFPSNLLRSLYIESNSNPVDYVVWVGTENIGLLRLPVKNGKPLLEEITRYGTEVGMLDYIIHVIVEDDNGNFWFNTNRGIFRVPKTELEAYHNGEISVVNSVSFGENDGLRNREGNGGAQYAGIKGLDGRLWFASQNGVVSMNPQDFEHPTSDLIPNVVIEEIEVADSVIYSNDGEIHLAKDQRDFEVHFTVLGLVSSEKNNLKYRLLGFNDKWQSVSDRRSAVYTNVPSGKYIFEVMGANHNGTWNPEPASLSFVVAPYFYETTWFLSLGVGLLILFVFGGFQWRLKAIKLRQQKLEELVLERTTELKKEKELTEEQAERLKELDQTKTRFFTNISHELRTPLTLIMSPLQKLISEDEKFDKNTQKQFRRMLLNSERLLRLIDQTLELTRLEQGKTKIKVREIEVVSFLSVLVDLFRGVAENKSISISFEKESAGTSVYADPDKLDKIVANLLSNAIKFTRPGGAIRLVLDESKEAISISVIDSGIGIETQEQDYIFERFYQVDSSETRNHEGSGIGLSLARDFARLHQGDLSVSSEKGIGSMFTLTLKKGKDHFMESDFAEIQHSISPEYHDSMETEELGENNQAELISRNKTVLIVEDNAGLREFIYDLLEDTYHVIEAENGAIGLEKARESLPDLIIADIMMPEMDGLSFNKELKEDLETASIPVIFLTAKADRVDKIKGLESGSDDYITKPFDPALLKLRVENLIQSRYRLRELILQEFNVDAPEELQDPFLVKVNEVLATHFTNQDFNVKMMAKELHLDRTQVLRKIKDLTGLTPTDYLKQYRMSQAEEMLKNSAGNVSEIAYATGYSSLSYFSFSFKEYFGVSPSEFLLQKQGE